MTLDPVAARSGSPTGSPITFDVTVTPVDAAGELLFDQQVEASGTGTIA